MIKITYLEHSGFAVDCDDYVLIFDYYEKIIIPDLTLAATNLEVTPYDSREGIATKHVAYHQG